MQLTKLTQKEEFSLREKVGDLTGFKAGILNSRINVDDYGIYKDDDVPLKPVYIALKHNPLFLKKETGLYAGRL
jgi:hypothetical protein